MSVFMFSLAFIISKINPLNLNFARDSDCKQVIQIRYLIHYVNQNFVDFTYNDLELPNNFKKSHLSQAQIDYYLKSILVQHNTYIVL